MKSGAVYRDESAERRRPVVIFLVAGVGAAVAAEVAIRVRDLPGAMYLPALGLLYLSWWVALSGAIWRTSGRPVQWYTLAAPASAGALVLLGEIAIAVDADYVGENVSSLGVMSFALVPVVALFGAVRSGRRWKAGIVAWSLLAFHAAVSAGALVGIPFGTFGTESRADELMFYALVPPLVGLIIAALLAPRLSTWRRVVTGMLIAATIAVGLSSESDGGPALLLTLVLAGGFLWLVDSIGRYRSERPPTSEV